MQTTPVSLVEVSIVQLNVRYPCNLTFSYTSIEIQRAYVYMKYERVETMHITFSAMDFMPLFTERLVGYYGKWRLQQNLGIIIRFMDWQACCFVGSFEIYDGFESHYLIAQKNISNYYEGILDVTTTYYLATLVFQLNHTLNKDNDDPLFALRFAKELVNVQIINSDNFSTTINNFSLMHLNIRSIPLHFKIAYFSNQLDIHVNDMGKSWKVLRPIFEKIKINVKRNIVFSLIIIMSLTACKSQMLLISFLCLLVLYLPKK